MVGPAQVGLFYCTTRPALRRPHNQRQVISVNTNETGAPRVAIIGAGFSGIAAAVALKKRGIDDFVIFDRSPGLGGTWRHNTYPGAEVDLESHIYSFSFERYDWTRT